jgi:hypothetical protein
MREVDMRSSRVLFGGASLSALLLLLALGTSCRDQKPKHKSVLVACMTTVTVDPTTPSGVVPEDIYVCPNTNVTWNANGHKFVVFFKKKHCPFTTCKFIDDQHAVSSTVVSMTVLTVYDYGILIDGDQLFDPHVVGGGGNLPASTAGMR